MDAFVPARAGQLRETFGIVDIAFVYPRRKDTLGMPRTDALDCDIPVDQAVVQERRWSRPSMWCNFGAGHRAAFSGGLGCNL